MAPTLAVARRALGTPSLGAEVNRFAERVRGWLGRFPTEVGEQRWGIAYDAAADPLGEGVLPLLALVVTAPEVAAWHRDRGVPATISTRTLGELGQQVWVNRVSFGRFGLRSYAWLPVTWCGSLYWLGRLQFNLQLVGEEWVCSTHIPRSGPLDPAAVEESFRQAARFFPRHFGDYPAADFWCRSWLLDPDLAEALGPESNIARFQRRWQLDGTSLPGEADLLLFVFGHREAVEPDALPRDTALRRIVGDRLRAGGHWGSWVGRIPMRDWAP